MPGSEAFDLQATLDQIGLAFTTVVCRIGFEVALHGLVVVGIVAVLGLSFVNQRHRAGRPLIMVARRVAIFCSVLLLPGLITFIFQGTLPQVGNLQPLNSVGMLGFWTLLVLHLSMEEMNFEWF